MSAVTHRAEVRGRPRTGAAGRWLAERCLVLVSGLAGAIPVIVAIARILDARWTALGDDALIATRALDTLTSGPPLVGQWSSGASGATAEQTFSMGPMLFWLLALPSRLLDTSWLAVICGLVNVGSVLGIVAVAHRRGGRPFMFATAAALAVTCASFPGEVLGDVWNPTVPLLPLTLLVFLCWSLACGEYRLLPLTVLVASFVMQTHLAYVLPAVAALAVGFAGLVVSRRWTARDHKVTAGSATAWRPWAVAAVVVAGLCWSAPLVDQAIHRPGNLVLLGRAAATDQPKLGRTVGTRAVARAVGIPPWWLRKPKGPLDRIADLSNTPGGVTVASAVLVLFGLVVVAAAGWRRRRIDVAAGASLALALCAALAFSTSSIPQNAYHTVGYVLLWASPAGMFAFLVLGWSGAELLATGRAAAVMRRPAVALVGVGAVAAVGAVVAARTHPPSEFHLEMRAIAARLETAIPAGDPVRVEAGAGPAASFTALDFEAGIVYALRRDGHAVAVPGLVGALGSRYLDDRVRARHIVRVDVGRPPPPAARALIERTVVRNDQNNPFAVIRPARVVVSLAPASRAP